MSKQTIKRQIAKLFNFSYRNGTVILNYHSVNPDGNFSLHPIKFEQQIKFLAEKVKVITLNSVENLATDTFSVIITFDDGYEDNFIYAYPILKKYNLPATIFLTSDFILNGVDITKDWLDYKGLRPLKIEQIKEMVNSGLISFGSHGKTHSRMSELSNEEFFNELFQSKKDIEDFLRQPIVNFAFPFGQKKDRGLHRDELIRRAGFVTVCTTDWGINSFDKLDLYNLKRIRVDHHDSLEDFLGKISGSWDFVKWFQKIRNLL